MNLILTIIHLLYYCIYIFNKYAIPIPVIINK